MAYEYTTINFNQIELDTLNPRLPTSLHNKSEEAILEYMIMHGDVISLMEAIGQNGFFPGEPIIVIKIDENKYKVIEGNRRLSAIKLINNPELAPVLEDRIKEVVEGITREILQTLNLIFCLVASTDEEKQKVDKFLGYRHITGTKNWKSLERARYLNKLYHSEKNKGLSDIEVHKKLAKTIGSKSDYVKRVLVGFSIYTIIEEKKFFHINGGGLNDKTFPFVNIADSINRTNIARFLGVDILHDNPLASMKVSNLELWAKWLYEKENGKETRITGTSNQLGMLDKILASEDATQQFIYKGKSLEEAVAYTIDKEIFFSNLIKNSRTNLSDAITLIHIKQEYDSILDSELQTIVALCRDLYTSNNSKKEKEVTNAFKL